MILYYLVFLLNVWHYQGPMTEQECNEALNRVKHEGAPIAYCVSEKK